MNFEEFYAKNFKKLVNYLRKWIKSDAEDVAQDIMLELLNNKKLLNACTDNESYFWVFIVKTKVYHYFAARRKEREHMKKLLDFARNSEIEATNLDEQMKLLFEYLDDSEKEIVLKYLKNGKVSEVNESVNWNKIQRTFRKCREIMRQL